MRHLPNCVPSMAVEENNSAQTDSPKLSHKKWKALKKKEKRKAVRQARAKQQETVQVDLSTNTESSDDEKKPELKQHTENEHRKWLEREKEAQTLWQLKKEREEKEKQRIEEQNRQIQLEWEEREKLEKEEREEREKKEEEKRVKQEALLKEATANENKNGDAWHNPIAPTNYGREQLRDTCPFFKKTGVCRFGDRCSRAHPEPEEMFTLLFPGMYSHFELEQTLRDEYDTDIGLEYEEGETYQHFLDFYRDVLPEFQKLGQVIQFKVCCNYEPHLRGNVYVKFRREEEAQSAYAAFNGRYYGGKQLSAQFVYIEKWKLAICGLYGTNRCPKGKNCNFLHVFRNPNNEFRKADFDQNRYRGQLERNFSDRHRNGYNSSRRSNSYRRSRSRERTTRSRSHRRSRSRSLLRKHSRSRSPSRKRSRSPSKKSSRSPSKRRSRSPSKKRSRSPSKKRSRSPSKKMSRSPSKKRSRSPGRYRSTSRKMSRTPIRRSRSPLKKRSRSRDSRGTSPRSVYTKSRRHKSRSRSKSRRYSVVKSRSRSKSRSPNSSDEIKNIERVPQSNNPCDSIQDTATSKEESINSVSGNLCDIPLPLCSSLETSSSQKQDNNKRSDSPEKDKHSHRRKSKKYKKERHSSESVAKYSETVDSDIKESVKNVSKSLSLSNSPSKLALVNDIIQQSLAE